jgi:serine/threonine-protein kinase
MAGLLLALIATGTTGCGAEGDEVASMTSAITVGFSLRDVSTLFCLDSNYARNAYTLGCNGGTFQKWLPRKDGFGGTWSFQDLETKYCLDSNTSGDVYTNPCGGRTWRPGSAWTATHPVTSTHLPATAATFSTGSSNKFFTNQQRALRA